MLRRRRRHHRCDDACHRLAAAFGAGLPGRCRSKEARSRFAVGGRRKRSRVSDQCITPVAPCAQKRSRGLMRMRRSSRWREVKQRSRGRGDRAFARSRPQRFASALAKRDRTRGAPSPVPAIVVRDARLPYPGRGLWRSRCRDLRLLKKLGSAGSDIEVASVDRRLQPAPARTVARHDPHPRMEWSNASRDGHRRRLCLERPHL